MVYIQVYIPEKNKIYDFRISSKITVLMLKDLVVEAVYNVRYDLSLIGKTYMLLNFNNKKVLNDDMKLDYYGVYNGQKFILV